MNIFRLILNLLCIGLASSMQMKKYDVHENKSVLSIENTVPLTFVESQLTCALECSIHPSCCMVSYSESQKTCNLYITGSCNDTLLSASGWVVLRNIYTLLSNALRDCQAILNFHGNGVHTIYPNGIDGVEVFCENSTLSNGIWTVIQRRFDGSVDFYRNWNEYKTGFGTVHGEYWIGNDNLHELTHEEKYQVLIVLEDWNSTKKYAMYEKFAVNNEKSKYKLTVKGYSGNAGDSFYGHDGHSFSTYDQDHDGYGGDCAKLRHGGFWYAQCATTNPNGKYVSEKPEENSAVDGIFWYTFHGRPDYSLKKYSMMLRRLDLNED